MGTAYIISLIVGAFFVLLSMFGGGDIDGDVDVDFDLDTDVDFDGEGSTAFFGTSAIKSQIERFPDYAEAFAKGDSFGPVKLGKKQSNKSTSKYWCLIFPNEEGY